MSATATSEKARVNRPGLSTWSGSPSLFNLVITIVGLMILLALVSSSFATRSGYMGGDIKWVLYAFAASFLAAIFTFGAAILAPGIERQHMATIQIGLFFFGILLLGIALHFGSIYLVLNG